MARSDNNTKVVHLPLDIDGNSEQAKVVLYSDLTGLVVFNTARNGVSGFVYDLPRVKTDQEANSLLSAVNNSLSEGGLEGIVDLMDETRFALTRMKGNLRDSLNYSRAGIAIGKRLGKDKRKEFAGAVQSASDLGLGLNKAIGFGNAVSVKNDKTKAGSILAKAAGFDRESAVIFGGMYSQVADRFGLEDATGLFAPSYMQTVRLTGKQKLTNEELAILGNHVLPVFDLFREQPEYRKQFGNIVEGSFYAAFVTQISRDPDESLEFSKNGADVLNAGYDHKRWVGSVQDYVKKDGFSLGNAVKLSTALEVHDKQNGIYRRDDVIDILNLHTGSEEDKVAYAVERLNAKNNGNNHTKETSGDIESSSASA